MRGRLDPLADLGEELLASLVGRGRRVVGLATIFALGAGGLIAAIGIDATAARQVRDRLTAAALDEVVAHPLDTADATQPDPLPAATIPRALAIDGVQAAGRSWAVPRTLAPVSRLAPATGTRSAGGRDRALVDGVAVVGVTPGIFDVYAASTAPASAPALLGDHRAVRVAILGRAAAQALGVAGPGPGVRIWVAGVPVEVVGVVSHHGRAAGLDSTVLVPALLARELSNGTAEESLRLRTRAGFAFPVARAVAAAVSPDRPGRVEVEPVPDLRTLRRGVDTDLGSAATILAAVMLVLAAVTTANVMAMDVENRRSEIALRRAVGMSRRAIALAFLLEGASIGVLGGAAGTVLGIAATLVDGYAHGWTVVLPLWLMPLGASSGIVVGLVAAGRAAARAARLPPALAIRA